MKKIFYLLAALALLIGCDADPIYSVDDTNIAIVLDTENVYNSQLTINYVPENDEVFYLTGLIEKSTFDKYSSDSAFMKEKLDSAYKEYKNWCIKHKEEYPNDSVRTFRNTLNYCRSTCTYKLLHTNTEYVSYAFVVDPDQVKYTGKLHKKVVKTAENTITLVSFDIKFLSRGYEQDPVQIQPSDLTAPYYYAFMDYGEISDTLNPEKEFFERLQMIQESGQEIKTVNGFINIFHDPDFSDPKQYIYIVGYDDGYTTPLWITLVDYENEDMRPVKAIDLNAVDWSIYSY